MAKDRDDLPALNEELQRIFRELRVAFEKFDQGVVERYLREMPYPTERDLCDPMFAVIWEVTKDWEVSVPDYIQKDKKMGVGEVMLIIEGMRRYAAQKAMDALTSRGNDDARPTTANPPAQPQGGSAQVPKPRPKRKT